MKKLKKAVKKKVVKKPRVYKKKPTPEPTNEEIWAGLGKKMRHKRRKELGF